MPASWLEDLRKEALGAYEAEEVPTWRRSGFWTTSLRKLDLDALEPRRHEPADELPELVREDIGDAPLAGLVVQRGASTIHVSVDPAAAEQGVIVSSLEHAAEKIRTRALNPEHDPDRLVGNLVSILCKCVRAHRRPSDRGSRTGVTAA